MEEKKNDNFTIQPQGDLGLWVCTILLIGIGSLVVYSASSARAVTTGMSTEQIFVGHLGTMALGVIAMIMCSKINYRWFGAFSLIMVLISLVLMALVSFTSAAVTINDASRWLRVPIIGLTFQPSDFAKLSIMIYLASTLSKIQKSVDSFKEVLKSLILPLMLIGMIAWQNISTGILLCLLLGVIMYISRIELKVFGIFLACVVFMSPLLYLSPRFKTAVSRITDYFETNTEEVGYSDLPYQVEQSNIALALGGFTGSGLGHSQQKYFLPEAFSDYIYAVIIEELGMIMGVIILLVFLTVFYRTMKITQKTTNPFAGLLVTSLGLLVVLQALIHMAVVTGLFPVTGLTLPWISTGGTSIVFTGMAFGIILNVSKETQLA
jgi:cell division protein FtsW